MTSRYDKISKEFKSFKNTFENSLLNDTRVLDFRNTNKELDKELPKIVKQTISKHLDSSKNPSVYTLEGIEGFYFIPNGISEMECIEIVSKCLLEFCEDPNVTNLDATHGKRDSKLWDSSTKSPISIMDYECSIVTVDNDDKELVHSPLLKKLRWATLGYHYDWTERCYREEEISDLPNEIEDLGKYACKLINNETTTIKPEAAIVNFYNMGSTMGGHQDDLEFTFDHPVVSYSFGQSAIFLLGGETKDIAPIPIILRHGDILVMGGASRLNYHGVPCVLQSNTLTLQIEKNNYFKNQPKKKQKHYREVLHYLSSTRVNINIRQVLAEDVSFKEAVAMKRI